MHLFKTETSKQSPKTLVFVSFPKPTSAQRRLFSACSSQSALTVQFIFGASSLPWLNPFSWLVLLLHCHISALHWELLHNARHVFQTFLRCVLSGLKFSSFCSRPPAKSFECRCWLFQQFLLIFDWVSLIACSCMTDKSVIAYLSTLNTDLECFQSNFSDL